MRGYESINKRPLENNKQNADSKFEDDRLLYITFIGVDSLDYYLKIFSRFSTGENRTAWNWAAFLFTFLWCVYRKMWLKSFLYVFLACGTYVLYSIVLGLPIKFYFIALYVLPGIYANNVYYDFCKENIALIKREYSDVEMQREALLNIGGVSWSGCFWSLTAIIFFLLMSLFNR